MLIINTKENNSIFIGNHIKLLVHKIFPEDNSIEIIIKNTLTNDFINTTIKAGVSYQVVIDVTVTLTRILKGREYLAALGFDAPLEIKIKGEWFGR